MANLPTRNNNPGDLRDTSTGLFRKFNSPQEGFDALKNDLNIKISGKSKSGVTPDSDLLHFSSIYAPSSDNNDPVGYANKLSKKLGVPVNTPIKNLANRMDDFASAIADNEGYQGQRVSGATESAPQAKEISQVSKPQLTHDQLIGNINAMEQQGAKPNEIQEYLDSLKGNSQQTQSQPKNGQPGSDGFVRSVNIPASNTQSDQKKQPGVLGSVGDSIVKLGSSLTDGGSDILGNYFGTEFGKDYEHIKGLLGGQDNSKYYEKGPGLKELTGGLVKTLGSIGSLAVGGKAASGLLSSLKGGTALASKELPLLVKEATGLPTEEFAKLSSKELYSKMREASELSDSPVLKVATKEAFEKVLRDAKIGSLSELNPAKAKAMGLTWKAVRAGVGLLTGYEFLNKAEDTIKGLIK